MNSTTNAHFIIFFRNESIIHYVVITPTPILYRTVHTKSESHAGEYLFEKIMEIIDEIEPSKVLADITDNSSAMIKARRIIKEKYAYISIYSCAAYNLNSLVGDIMKAEAFKYTEESEKDKKVQKVSLKLPGKTRWGPILFCAESLLYNKRDIK